MSTKKLAAIAIAATAVLGAGAYAYAETGTPGPSISGAASAGAGAAQAAGNAATGAGRRLGILRRAEHGDLIVRGKDGFQNVTFDRGKVTAVSATSITVQRPDGQSVTKTIDASTKFKGVGSASDVQTGKPAIVVSDGDHAVAVAQADRAG